MEREYCPSVCQREREREREYLRRDEKVVVKNERVQKA